MSFSWSYSAYCKALECLACFKRRYIDNEPEAGPQSADLLFGSCCHSAWNASLTGQDAQAVFDLYWGSYANTEMKSSKFDYRELEYRGKELLRKFEKAHKERFEHQDSEKRLYGEYKGIKLEGTFDFIGRLDGKRVLLDLKTSAYNYPEDKQYTALQLNLYTHLAILNGYNQPEEIGYIVFNKGAPKGEPSVQKPLIWKFNQDTMFKMLDEMTDYCKMFNTMIESGKFPRNPNHKYHSYPCYEPKETNNDL